MMLPRLPGAHLILGQAKIVFGILNRTFDPIPIHLLDEQAMLGEAVLTVIGERILQITAIAFA